MLMEASDVSSVDLFDIILIIMRYGRLAPIASTRYTVESTTPDRFSLSPVNQG